MKQQQAEAACRTCMVPKYVKTASQHTCLSAAAQGTSLCWEFEQLLETQGTAPPASGAAPAAAAPPLPPAPPAAICAAACCAAVAAACAPAVTPAAASTTPAAAAAPGPAEAVCCMLATAGDVDTRMNRYNMVNTQDKVARTNTRFLASYGDRLFRRRLLLAARLMSAASFCASLQKQKCSHGQAIGGQAVSCCCCCPPSAAAACVSAVQLCRHFGAGLLTSSCGWRQHTTYIAAEVAAGWLKALPEQAS